MDLNSHELHDPWNDRVLWETVMPSDAKRGNNVVSLTSFCHRKEVFCFIKSKFIVTGGES